MCLNEYCVTRPRGGRLTPWLVLVFTLSPQILYILFVATAFRGPWAILAFVLIYLLWGGSYFMTAYRNPGVLTETSAWNKVGVAKYLEDNSIDKDWKRFKGSIYVPRWCETCEMIRPPLCSHCSDCNKCILELDHHCGWVGNCIGKQNLKWFLLMTCLPSIIALVQIPLAIFVMIDNGRKTDFKEYTKRPELWGIIGFFSFGTMLGMG